MVIKVLGSGCKSCLKLAENVKDALSQEKMEAELVKVTDFAQIAAYGVMSTPALVIDEKVVASGKVLKAGDIAKLLRQAENI